MHEGWLAEATGERAPRWLPRLALASAGGLGLALAFPPLVASVPFHLEWGLPFLALVPFLHALRAASLPQGAVAGGLFGLLAAGLPARWYPAALEARGVGPLAAWGAWLGLALPFAAYGVLHVAAQRRLRHWPLAVVAFWTTLELLRSACPLLPYSWFTLGHALALQLAFCQAATVVGEAGLAVVVLVPALLLEQAVATWRARYRSRAVTFAVAGLGLPVVVWELGFFVLVAAVPVAAAPADPIQVALVQDESSVASKLELTALACLMARRDATPRLDVILWPEGSVTLTPGEPVPDLSRVAALSSAALVLGVRAPTAGGTTGGALVLERGAALSSSRKAFPDPLLEPGHGARGTGGLTLVLGGRVLGVLVGQDATRASLVRALAVAGARVLLVPASEPREWPREAHVQAALLLPLRACEAGLPIARAASSGVSFGLDANGRHYVDARGSGRAAAIARLAGSGDPTPFVSGGFALPWALAGVALVALALLLAPARARQGNPGPRP